MLENHKIRPRLLILLAASLALPGAPAQAADWRLTAARKTPFGASLAFLDMHSIRGGDGRVQFSTLTFFDRRTRRMNRVAAAVTADCRSMTYRLDRIASFWNQQPLGTWHSATSVSATPKSNIHDSISAACGIAEPGTPVERIEHFAATHFGKRSRRRILTLHG